MILDDVTLVDRITLVVFLAPLLIWLPWELVLVLWLRPRARRLGLPMPQTISMVARGLGYRVAALVYLWSGLGVHFWLNRSMWGSTALGVLFWAIPLALLLWSIIDWNTDVLTWPRWKRIALWPGTVYAYGGLSGWFFFPQKVPSGFPYPW